MPLSHLHHIIGATVWAVEVVGVVVVYLVLMASSSVFSSQQYLPTFNMGLRFVLLLNLGLPERLSARSYAKIEPIQPEFFTLNNEFNDTFFEGSKMMDKTFLVPKNSIGEGYFSVIPLMDKGGVLIS